MGLGDDLMMGGLWKKHVQTHGRRVVPQGECHCCGDTSGEHQLPAAKAQNWLQSRRSHRGYHGKRRSDRAPKEHGTAGGVGRPHLIFPATSSHSVI